MHKRATCLVVCYTHGSDTTSDRFFTLCHEGQVLGTVTCHTFRPERMSMSHFQMSRSGELNYLSVCLGAAEADGREAGRREASLPSVLDSEVKLRY